MNTKAKGWNGLVEKNWFIRFIDILLRGAGQVFFQNNPITGLLFYVGIFWGAAQAGMIQVGIGSVVALVAATLTAMFLRVDEKALRSGLYGYNAALVGAAIPTFLAPTTMMWVYLVLGGVISTVVMLAIAKMFKTWNVAPLTFPFVLTTWFLVLGAYAFGNITIASMGPPAIPQALSQSAGNFAFSWKNMFLGFANGVSQVYLIKYWITGIIFIIAIAVNSRWSAFFGALGAVLSWFTAIALGADPGSVTAGLFGFSAVLTGIAVGSIFNKPSWAVTIYTLIAIIFTTVVQGALDIFLAPVGIPTFTAPFVFTTWLFLLPKENFVAIQHEPVDDGLINKKS